jgi:hypothetical protein
LLAELEALAIPLVLVLGFGILALMMALWVTALFLPITVITFLAVLW